MFWELSEGPKFDRKPNSGPLFNLKQKTAGANPNGLLRNAINGHLVLVADNSFTW